MGRLQNEYLFGYDKIHKRWRKGGSPMVKIYTYTEDSALCVVRCLEEYYRDRRNGKQYIKSNSFKLYFSSYYFFLYL